MLVTMLVMVVMEVLTDIILQSGDVRFSTAGRFEVVCWPPQFLRNLVCDSVSLCLDCLWLLNNLVVR
jgi:hypothetical protein